MRQHRNKRRWRIAGLALVLLAGALLAIPGIAFARTIQYEITFLHPDGTTTTVSGVANENDTFVPNVGGTTWPDGRGMVMHLSCSDDFPGGWGEKQGPDPFLDSAWQVLSYTIYKDGNLACTGGLPQPPPEPDIDIEKATNGEDADFPTGPEIGVGDDVIWTYVVTNTGEVDLFDNVVTDDELGEIGTIPFLAPGESATLEAFGVAEEGQYANLSTVVGTARIPLSVSSVANKPEGRYFAFLFEDIDSGDTLFIEGEKQTNDQFFPNLGGASQDSPIGMTIHLSCSDPFPGGWGQKQGPDQWRDSAFHIQSFWIYEVKGDGEVNTKCGSPFPVEEQVTDEDPSHYIGIPGHPDIDIEKYTNGEDADTPPGPSIPVGGTVTWTYVVTNTGDVTLYGIEVFDNIEGPVDDTWVLAPGESVTFELEGTAVSGQYANTACVYANTEPTFDGEVVDDCDPSHYLPPGEPAIDIEKYTNGEDADDPPGPSIPVGGTVTWTYVVTNTGDVTLYGSEIRDDKIGWIGFIWRLEPGQSRTFEKTGVARPGQYENEACVTANSDPDGLGQMVDDCDPSHYLPPGEPGVDIEKHTNGQDADDPPGPTLRVGDRVTWTYIVSNTGDVDLVDLEVTDDVEGYIGTIAFLGVGRTATLTHYGTAVRGQYANLGCVVGYSDVDGTEVEDCDPSHYDPPYDPYDPAAAIDLEKHTNGQDADDPRGPEIMVGHAVEWTYELTNTGDQTLWGIFLFDEEEGRIDCPRRSLAPGASMTCEAYGIAQAGQYQNVAWVDAWADDGTYVTDEDPSHYFGVSDGYDGPPVGIYLEKFTNDRDADTAADAPSVFIGSRVTWTYRLTNTGTQTLYGIYLYDEEEGPISCPSTRLAAGATMTCTLTGYAGEGLYYNLAWVDAWGEDGTYVSDEDPSHYFGIGYGN